MKLIDILVRDLKVWPEFNRGQVFDSITQDGDGFLNTTDEGYEPMWNYADNQWSGASSTILEPEIALEVAEDCQTAVITKEQWEKAKIENTEKRSALVEELQTQAKELVDLANSMKESGPIEWRNRIREINLQMSDLQEERESLINKLEAEGFLLIEEVNNSLEKLEVKHIHVTEDMSDWRNWKEGDLVECVETEYGVSVGAIGKVIELEDEDYDGYMPVHIQFPENGCCWAAFGNLKWHSRPTKQST